jgi:hypothetical protein
MHKRVTCSPEERAAAKGAVSAMTEWQVAIVWSPEGGANARSLATSALAKVCSSKARLGSEALAGAGTHIRGGGGAK